MASLSSRRAPKFVILISRISLAEWSNGSYELPKKILGQNSKILSKPLLSSVRIKEWKKELRLIEDSLVLNIRLRGSGAIRSLPLTQVNQLDKSVFTDKMFLPASLPGPPI